METLTQTFLVQTTWGDAAMHGRPGPSPSSEDKRYHTT